METSKDEIKSLIILTYPNPYTQTDAFLDWLPKDYVTRCFYRGSSLPYEAKLSDAKSFYSRGGPDFDEETNHSRTESLKGLIKGLAEYYELNGGFVSPRSTVV